MGFSRNTLENLKLSDIKNGSSLGELKGKGISDFAFKISGGLSYEVLSSLWLDFKVDYNILGIAKSSKETNLTILGSSIISNLSEIETKNIKNIAIIFGGRYFI